MQMRITNEKTCVYGISEAYNSNLKEIHKKEYIVMCLGTTYF